MNGDYGQSQATQVQEGRCAEFSDKLHSEGGDSAASGGARLPEHGGFSGSDRLRGSLSGALAGGILSQLIEDTRTQLAESEECLDWYRREIDKNQARLKNLLRLQKLAEEEQYPEEEDDTPWAAE